MHKRVSSSVLALAFALSLTTSSAARLRAAGKSAHTYIPHADLETLMKSAGDHPARVVDIAKSYNLGAYLLHQDAKKGTTPPPLNGWAHSDISELYYVIRGSGTWLIGGGLGEREEG